jgi:membrane-associated phospholipid phosphatase
MRALAAIVVIATMLAGSGAARAEPTARLRFNGFVDIPITVGLASSYGVSELVVKARLAPRAPYWDDRDTNGADILAPLDRLARRLRWEHPHTAGRISDGGLALSMVSALGFSAGAGAFDHDTPAHLAENATIVLEAMSTAMAMNQLTKFLAGRQRPCAHFGLYTERPCFADGADDNVSAFSGHSTFTTSLAVANGMVATMRQYRLAPLVWASGAVIAVSTSYLRLAADKHYLSDVVTGTVIGVAVGFFIPYLFHGPRAEINATTESRTGAASASLRSAPVFSVSGTW